MLAEEGIIVLKKKRIIITAIVIAVGLGIAGALYTVNQSNTGKTSIGVQQDGQEYADVPTPPNIDLGNIPINKVAGSYQLVSDETIETLRNASIVLRETSGGACAALKGYASDWESSGHTFVNEHIATINQRMAENTEYFGAEDFHYIKGLNTLLASNTAKQGNCDIDGVNVMRIELRYSNSSSSDRYLSSKTGGLPAPAKFDDLIRTTVEKSKSVTPAITCLDPDGYGIIGCAAVLSNGRYEVIVWGGEHNLEDCIKFLGALIQR